MPKKMAFVGFVLGGGCVFFFLLFQLFKLYCQENIGTPNQILFFFFLYCSKCFLAVASNFLPFQREKQGHSHLKTVLTKTSSWETKYYTEHCCHVPQSRQLCKTFEILSVKRANDVQSNSFSQIACSTAFILNLTF